MVPRKETFSIKDFDMYNNKIGLFFNKKNTLSSYFGLTLTFLYFGFFVSLLVYYTEEIFKKSQLKVYNSIRYPTGTPSINLNNDLFYFAFGAEDPKNTSVFIDVTIYYPRVIYYESIKENNEWHNIGERRLETEKCNINKFSNRHKLLFKNNSLSTNYCVKDFNNIKLSGSYSYNEISYIKIALYPCKNSTKNNNHCKPQNIIDKYLSSSYISIQMEDIGITPTEYNNPTIPIIKDLYTTIGKGFYKEMTIYYKIVEIENDIGIFNSYTETTKFIKFDTEYDTMYMRDESDYYNGESLCRVIIQLSDTIEVHNRIYGKISEVFAKTGGYMQFINTLFCILSFIFNTYNMNAVLIDNLFDYNLSKNKLILKHDIEKTNKYEEYKNNIFIPSAYFKNYNKDYKGRNKKSYSKHIGQEGEINNSVKCIDNPWKSEQKMIKYDFSPNSKQEKFCINITNLNNINKMVYANENIGNSSLSALKKVSNFENVLSLNKNIINIEQKGNIFTNNKSILEINNQIDRFKLNIFEYYFYRNCFRNCYKKQFYLYEYGLEVIKNQLDIMNVFNANFFFNILFKRLMKTKINNEED